MSSYDAVVVGAGPAGSAAAVAFARRGARVALLEADPRATRRFAGEWLHPGGVAILRQFGFAPLAGECCRGFAVLPDDAGPPVLLGYRQSDTALIYEHEHLVRSIREQAISHAGIVYYEHARATSIDVRRRSLVARCKGREIVLHGERIIGADGQGSWLRRKVSMPQEWVSPSYQAAVMLSGVTLPHEGFGHLVLGGPSYALLYRLAADRVRAVFDLPREGWSRVPATVWEAYGPVMPGEMRPALRAALGRGEITWTVTRRASPMMFASGPVMFVGDAARCVHPLTAAGMTLAFMDAAACATASCPTVYARGRVRDSLVPMLLADLLYDVFTGRSPATAALRAAVFEAWRARPTIREHTLDLLSVAELRRSRFAAAFLGIAGRGLAGTVAELASQGRFGSIPAALADFGRGARDLAGTLRPGSPHGRGRSSNAGAPVRRDSGVVADSRAGTPIEPLEDGPTGAALDHLMRHQLPHGAWSGRNNSMLFCLPLYVGAAYVAKVPIDDTTTRGMVRFLRAHQRSDGGWGLHLEGQTSVMMSTSMCYVAARMLGLPPDDEVIRRARAWIRARGGPIGAASLAKSFLAALGLFDYRGVDPVPPELWLLPACIHPARLYGHMRANYVPLSFLYGGRLSAPRDALLDALRDELYPSSYETIDWRASRGCVAASDALVPRSRLLRAIDAALALYERHPSRRLRSRALDRVLAVLGSEDRNTDHECFSLVTKSFHMLVWGILRPGSVEVHRHAARLPMYLEHDDPDGIDARTCSSSAPWDTALAIQAVVATGRAAGHRAALERAQEFLADRQILAEPESLFGYRSRATGGWAFSENRGHWPVTDCTAEVLRGLLAISSLVEQPVPASRLREAVGYILFHQNPDGGWPAYERARAPHWVSLLNRSDVFCKVMRDDSHVECTGSCLSALAEYRERFPADRPRMIADALARGAAFLRRVQRADGAWLGYWGVCFTYATRFAVEGLHAAGVASDDEAMLRASRFLESWQRADGSWGESVEGNRRHVYVPTREGHPVMTAWAVLALVAAGRRKSPAVRRGAEFLRRVQRPDGGFHSPGISGAFMHMHAMAYGSHARIFPLWALAAVDERSCRHRGRDPVAAFSAQD